MPDWLTHTLAGWMTGRAAKMDVSLLIAAAVAFLFPRVKQAFLLLAVGVATHFGLALLMRHVSDGMKLLFPLSWQEWRLDVVTSGDYRMTIVAVAVAGLFYLVRRARQTSEDKRYF